MQKLLHSIDARLNSITMYSLLMNGLLGLAIVSIVLMAIDQISFSAVDAGLSLVLLLVVSVASAIGFSKFFGGTMTYGASAITGLILFFIFRPANEVDDYLLLALVAFLAIASKYIIVWRKRHILNPAAAAAVAVSIIGIGSANWWVAQDSLIIPMVIFGFLVLRKLHRFTMFAVFALVSSIFFMLSLADSGQTFAQIAELVFVSFPLLFLGTIMLTEPMTMPPRHGQQLIFAGIVGALFGLTATGWSFGGAYLSPELALVAGNIVAFILAVQVTAKLTLVRREEIGAQLYNYVFASDTAVKFEPGQYGVMTVDELNLDSRGNTRTFSIASSMQAAQQAKPEVHFGIKQPEPASKFKQIWADMKPGDSIYMHYVGGSFVLPKDASTPVTLIAGGIGITPFRSMIDSLIQAGEQRDIVLLYQVRASDELAYRELFESKEAKAAGITFVPIVTGDESGWKGERGFVDADMLGRHAENWQTRHYYISGPPAMVSGYSRMLKSAGVSTNTIHHDYFSGY